MEVYGIYGIYMEVYKYFQICKIHRKNTFLKKVEKQIMTYDWVWSDLIAECLDNMLSGTGFKRVQRDLESFRFKYSLVQEV